MVVVPGFNPCFLGIQSEGTGTNCGLYQNQIVSILVFLEFSLKGLKGGHVAPKISRFNPCFLGIQSEGLAISDTLTIGSPSFNPCFLGIQSEGTCPRGRSTWTYNVSILVFLEFSLKERKSGNS